MVATGRTSEYWLVWQTRFRSNVLTNIIWVPALVIVLRHGGSWVTSAPRRHGEATLLAVLLLLSGGYLLGEAFGNAQTTRAFLLAPLPLLLWAAARFGTGGVSLSMLALSFAVILNAMRGRGPFSDLAPADNSLALQMFLTSLAAPLLLFAAVLEDRRRIETVIRDRQDQYRSIFESTGDPLLVINLESSVVAVNPAFSRQTGYSTENLLAVHPRTFLHLDDLQPFESFLARATAGDVIVAEGAVGLRRRTAVSGRAVGQAFHLRRAHLTSCAWSATSRNGRRRFRLLEQRVAERTRQLSTLLEISNTVSSTLELKPLLRVVLEQLKLVLPYTGATILVLEDDELAILDHHGPLTPEQIAGARFAVDWAIDGDAELRRASPLVIDNLWGEGPAAKGFRASAPAAMTVLFGYARSILLVPLSARDRLIGFLLIDSVEPDRYSLPDAQLAWVLANQAAVAIENARLYDQAREMAAFEERQRLARELHDSVTQTLYAVAMLGKALPGTWKRDPTQGRKNLAHLREMTESALAEMRTLLLELRPSALLPVEPAGSVAPARAARCAAGLKGRSRSTSRATPACRPRSTSRCTAWPRRPWATSPNTRPPRTCGSRCALRDEGVTLRVHDDGGGFDQEARRARAPGHRDHARAGGARSTPRWTSTASPGKGRPSPFDGPRPLPLFTNGGCLVGPPQGCCICFGGTAPDVAGELPPELAAMRSRPPSLRLALASSPKTARSALRGPAKTNTTPLHGPPCSHRILRRPST